MVASCLGYVAYTVCVSATQDGKMLHLEKCTSVVDILAL